MPYSQYLEITIKQLDQQFGSGYKGVRFSSRGVTEDIDIKENNTLQYTFTNLGLSAVKINEVVLYPGVLNPLLPPRTTYSPVMQPNEFDTTKYSIKFYKSIP
jgi:hypothetical protein